MALPAVPIMVTLRNGQPGGGTGFFLDIKGTTYLVTAAHLPTGEQPDDHWTNWHPELMIEMQHRPRVPLFTSDASGGRMPQFFFSRASDNRHRLVDVIAVPASPQYLGLEGVLIHSIQSAAPQVGELVTLHGYPVDTAGPWPVLRSVTGPVTGTAQAFLVIRVGSTGGFSGGPLLGADGRFLGMVIGSGRPEVRDDDDLAIVPGMLSCLPELIDGDFPPALSVPMYLGTS